VLQEVEQQARQTSGLSATRVAVEGCLGYREEISQQAQEHKKFGRERERRTHRLHLQDVYEQSVGHCLLWVMMTDKYVTQQLTTLVCSIT
jgi:hypothetical protein